MTFRIRQYVSPVGDSDRLSAVEMAGAIGFDPDEFSVRGSRRPGDPHPVPRSHAWKVVCREPGLSVDEQLERLVARLSPYQGAIRDLVHSDGDVSGVSLNVVRHLD